jgi:UMF1 family MFS transporter
MSVCSEFGYFRNKCLVGTAVVASLLLLIPFCFDTKDSLFWLGGVVLIAASFLYNTCHIIFNSYLPLLVQSHHKLVDARIQGHSAAELGDLAQNLAHETSVFGDVLVMFPMILSLLLVGTFLFLNVQDEHRAARLGIFLVGIWALVFCLLSCIFLPLQLGSLPTPSSTGGCVRAVFMRLKRMVIIGRRVPNTLRFLLAYSLVWAGSTTLMNAWTVFGISELKLSFGTVIWALNLFGACALLSNLCCFLLVQHSWITAQNVLYLALGTILLLPGMVYFGVLSQWEFFLFTGLCGAMGGPLYSFGRSFFAQIVPQGHESAFFAMHQLATSALGTASPLLLIIVQQFTTSYRAACFSVSLFLIGGCILLSRVDLDQARSDAEQLKSRLFASSCTQIVADDDETEQDASFPDLVLQIPVSSLSSTKNALGDSPVQTYSRELEVDGPRVIDTQHPEEDADIELAALEHEYASEDY